MGKTHKRPHRRNQSERPRNPEASMGEKRFFHLGLKKRKSYSGSRKPERGGNATDQTRFGALSPLQLKRGRSIKSSKKISLEKKHGDN